MLNRGCSQNFQTLNFLHIFVALLLKVHFLKGIRLKSFQYEMRTIFTESLYSAQLWEQWNTHNHAWLENVKLESNEILEISFFCLYLLIHAIKKMLLESLNIPLMNILFWFPQTKKASTWQISMHAIFCITNTVPSNARLKSQFQNDVRLIP